MPPLLILRHGETVWNREGRLQGGRDSELTALGRIQAARQGAILRAYGVVGLPAFASPARRARMSAMLAGLAATSKVAVSEIGLGEWEGRSLAEIAPPPGVTWKFAAPGGETRGALLARLAGFLRTLDGPTIVVTHGVVSIGLRAMLLGASDWDMLTDPQGVVHRVAEGRETILA
ncbi:histidine phosphatase family protein [uncultured Jannaschia sp.]|uniref:histidine phosphatase family protein n=1 Tax=uncultured Jannaschia sp. TaxID=293347 RepID=UPI002621B476|nr:histidine phosphatase family protein [uncultured Jannaschia sp.]